MAAHHRPPVRAADREWMNSVATMMLAAFQAFEPMFSRLTVLQCLLAVETLEPLFQYAYTDDVSGYGCSSSGTQPAIASRTSRVAMSAAERPAPRPTES
ncbi:hypothetical protein [Mycolicibacterium monacense]|uniref:hypothetical protein n=1 Tax=Mycolicibacterium monacense TaxID=85693 RepID=UPI0013F4EB63|nr:hypothetical protein [Mycolicibacterium monacense]